MSLTGWVGTLAAFCTTVAFVPQIVKLRKQGGRGLSYGMLFLYLAGVLLWLAYGIRIHAVAMMWANGVAAALVVISIVLKANPPANQLKSVSRRLRIAVDMDEVIADSFGRHLGLYNQRAGANLTAERVSREGLDALLPSESRDSFNAELTEPGSQAAQDEWQKTYFRGRSPTGKPAPDGHVSRLRLRKFKQP
jgi:uncharacterized protein with PQ loop repeat